MSALQTVSVRAGSTGHCTCHSQAPSRRQAGTRKSAELSNTTTSVLECREHIKSSNA